ncbi:ABC transporter ATP-binding protein/permease [Oligoflexaceae bacterium]|nr:ABC transporter ATP-binding protein/permease [Oligoflexaceae bacterium]
MLTFSRKFALPLWPWYLFGAIFLALTNYLTLQIPLLAKIIVNSIDNGQLNQSMSPVAIKIVVLGLLLILIRALSRIFIFWPGRKLEANIKSHLFARILHLPETFFNRYGLGDLISRLANDIGSLRAFFAFAMLQAMNLVFLLIFTISQMLKIHWELTVLSLLPLILMLVIARYINPLMYKYSRKSQKAVASLTNKVTEALVNVHIVQSNAAEKAVASRIAVGNEEVYRSNMNLLIIRQIVWPLMVLLAGLSQVVVLFYGGQEVAADRLTLGDIMAFNVFIGYLAFPLSALGIVLSLYQRCLSALDRISVIDDEKMQEVHPPTPSRNSDLSLEVANLNFEFQTDDEDSFKLRDVNFTVARGEHVGLFGGIGSGKTVLMDLISRIKEPQKGSVFLNGQDVLEIELQALREKIGYGIQVPQLLSDSIAENLQLGLTQRADASRLKAAAAEAEVLSEIDHFNKGWDTLIGEKGVRLSGGQKQRLALARVFIRNPELILLDDVLSAVDQSTEAKLIETIHRRDAALLISSHRPSILAECNRVIYLKEGRIVAIAPYETLCRDYPEISPAATEKTR